MTPVFFTDYVMRNMIVYALQVPAKSKNELAMIY